MTPARKPSAKLSWQVLHRLVILLCAALGCLVPLGFFITSYQNEKHEMLADAQLRRQLLQNLINQSPDYWSFQQDRLRAIVLTRHEEYDDGDEHRSVRDLAGVPIIATAGPSPDGPTLRASLPLLAAGQTVAVLNVVDPLAPELYHALLAALPGALLALTVYALIRRLLLRPLSLALEELEGSEARYRSLVEMAPSAVFVVERGHFRFSNSAGQRLLRQAHTGPELTVFDHVRPQEHATLRLQLDAAPQAPRLLETRWQCQDGSELPVEIQVAPLAPPLRQSALLLVSDISERQQHEEELRFQATHDMLTGLPNRLLLLDRIDHALARTQRKDHGITIAFIDLDHFKSINDSLGHDTGDKLLCEVAFRLCACLREGDTLARLGGDEFVAMLENDIGEADLSLLIGRLIECIAQPVELCGSGRNVSCSIGVSRSPEHGRDAETLLRHADAAMRQAKESGRNTFRFFTQEIGAQLTERVSLEASLHQALDEQQFQLYYQPQVELASGAIVGGEALLRWQHPHYGQILPSRFIPLTEDIGLIERLGAWVLNEACRQMRAWLDQGLNPPPLAVNLSARQFQHPELVAQVSQCLQRHLLPPQLLQLELTESLSMFDPEHSIATLRQLHETGVALALDDFGTGYSNLGYLKRFPVDKLKLDHSFVADLAGNPEDRVLCQTLIRMAHSLHLQVVAEGVERRGQLVVLAESECDQMQGFYFSPPLPPADYARLLTNPPRLERQELQRQAGVHLLLLSADGAEAARLQLLLAGQPYQVLSAQTPAQAFELMASHAVAVIGLCDADNDEAFLSALHHLYPSMRCLYLFKSLRAQPSPHYLVQPEEDPGALRRHIAEALAAHEQDQA